MVSSRVSARRVFQKDIAMHTSSITGFIGMIAAASVSSLALFSVLV
jgi:hypothetical protein